MRPVVLASLLAAIGFLGCESSTDDSGQRDYSSAEKYIYVDRSDAEYEYTVVWSGGKMFMQEVIFPGYTDRKWWVLSGVPDLDKLLLVNRWDSLSSAASPGPLYSRYVLSASPKPESPEWLRESPRLEKWLLQVRARLFRHGTPTDQLPDWIAGNDELKRILALDFSK